MMELARKGNNVTIYSSHRLDDRLDNLREHVVEPEFPFWKEGKKMRVVILHHSYFNAIPYTFPVLKQSGAKNLQELSKLNDEKLSTYLAQAGSSLMEYFLDNYQVKDLLSISPDDFDYDLIIVDLFYTEALLALGYHFRTPVIGIVSTDFGNYMEKIQDIMVPAACLPYDLENFDMNLGFWQRLNNVKQCLSRRNAFIEEHYGNQERIIKKHFTRNQGNERMDM